MAPVEAFTDHNPLVMIHKNEEQEPEITALEFGSAGISSDNSEH